MQSIVCPNCKSKFSLSEEDYQSVVSQIRDKIFEDELNRRVSELNELYAKQKDTEVQAMTLEVERRCQKELDDMKTELNRATSDRAMLKDQVLLLEKDAALKVQKAVANQKADDDKEIHGLQSQIALIQKDTELKVQQAVVAQERKDAEIIRQLQSDVEYYKDMKSRMSTKAIGESLERYCQNQFNSIRMAAFPRAYFEKDNDARSGSKGDFIYREEIEGVELLSIMFEMKNEMDETATKHKNEDFLKELDKDRREKNCEYAVLVSLLEADSDYYNAGIVDMSYRYPKMYVIRPQLFIPMITILRNAALNSFDARSELKRVQSMNMDVVNFESNLMAFKENISKNYDLASRKFASAIEEIDKAIANLEKVKKDLMSSSNNLRYLNDKTDKLTIRKLTKDSPSMRKAFEDAGVTV